MRLHAATQALNAGRRLGSLPNAPPALARFATVDPPTESGLRQAFAVAGSAALAASQPKLDGKPFLDRALARAEALITVRQGDHVLIGDPASGILARARTALDTGDLTGAVNAAAALTGPAAAAMAPWLTDARALIEARAALLTLADNG